MDPNANLREQIRLAMAVIRQYDAIDPKYGGEVNSYDAARLAELVIALDEWLKKGGFLPDAWELGRKHGDRT